MDEAEQRRMQWRAGDDALHREFLEFARLADDQQWPGQPSGRQPPGQESGPGSE
jgi:hypothetical protein